MGLGVLSNSVRPLCCVTELSYKVERDIETILLHLLFRMASLPTCVLYLIAKITPLQSTYCFSPLFLSF